MAAGGVALLVCAPVTGAVTTLVLKVAGGALLAGGMGGKTLVYSGFSFGFLKINSETKVRTRKA